MKAGFLPSLAMGLTASAFTLGALAQSAEETVNVTAQVNLPPTGSAVVSGLQDVVIAVDEIGPSGEDGAIQPQQSFCIFTPTQYFTLTLTGSNAPTSIGGGSYFTLTDASQADPSLSDLVYFVSISDTFSGSRIPLYTGPLGLEWGRPVPNIDSNHFNTDATCTDGENVTMYITLLTGDEPNKAVLQGLEDGQSHTFTDTLTLLIEPDI